MCHACLCWVVHELLSFNIQIQIKAMSYKWLYTPDSELLNQRPVLRRMLVSFVHRLTRVLDVSLFAYNVTGHHVHVYTGLPHR